MGRNEASKLVSGALLLTLAGLISKVLSAGYRIPLQNLTGDFGFYVYQQIYPFLGMTLILSLYGFPSAISRITVELKAEGKGLSVKSFYLPIFLIMLVINGMLFLFLYLNAYSLASLIGDANLATAYRLVAFSFLLLPFSALLRGGFQGNYQMTPTAYSQVGEQIVRVFIIIFVAYLFVNQKVDVYKIGDAAALASIIGAITAICILAVFFIRDKPFVKQQYKIPWGYYIRTILTLGIVASLNHMVLLIIQFADVFTLVPSLIEHGLSNIAAMEAKGVFDRGQPLIQLGTVLGSSFALAFIPAISKQNLQEEPAKMNGYIQVALLFGFYLSAGATIGLIVIFPEVNILLFQNMEGTLSLQILALAIFLSSTVITVSSVLQGLGYFKRTAGFIIGAFFIKWILNLVLVPLWGITGSAIATVFSLLLLLVVVLLELRRRLPEVDFCKKIHWLALGKAGTGMIGYILLIHFLVSDTLLASRFGLLLYVICIAITGAFIYIALLVKCRAFSVKELSMLPFGSSLLKLHKGRDSIGS